MPQKVLRLALQVNILCSFALFSVCLYVSHPLNFVLRISFICLFLLQVENARSNNKLPIQSATSSMNSISSSSFPSSPSSAFSLDGSVPLLPHVSPSVPSVSLLFIPPRSMACVPVVPSVLAAPVSALYAEEYEARAMKLIRLNVCVCGSNARTYCPLMLHCSHECCTVYHKFTGSVCREQAALLSSKHNSLSLAALDARFIQQQQQIGSVSLSNPLLLPLVHACTNAGAVLPTCICTFYASKWWQCSVNVGHFQLRSRLQAKNQHQNNTQMRDQIIERNVNQMLKALKYAIAKRDTGGSMEAECHDKQKQLQIQSATSSMNSISSSSSPSSPSSALPLDGSVPLLAPASPSDLWFSPSVVVSPQQRDFSSSSPIVCSSDEEQSSSNDSSEEEGEEESFSDSSAAPSTSVPCLPLHSSPLALSSISSSPYPSIDTNPSILPAVSSEHPIDWKYVHTSSMINKQSMCCKCQRPMGRMVYKLKSAMRCARN